MPRPKHDFRSNSKESYKKFIKLHPEHKSISYEQYDKILRTYNRMIVDHILDTGQVVKLPFGFGNLSINKKKQTVFHEKDGKKRIVLPVNWQATKKLWADSPEDKEKKTLIYIRNDHSEGYRFKWIWFPKSSRIILSDIWVFKPSRQASRDLAKKIKDQNKGYFYQSIYQEFNVKQSDKL